MRIIHAMDGSAEGSILVSHIKLDVCCSLAFMHERYENMADIVKLRIQIETYTKMYTPFLIGLN